LEDFGQGSQLDISFSFAAGGSILGCSYLTMPQVCDRSIGKGKTTSDVLEEVPVQKLSKLTYVDDELKEKILAPLHDSGVSWQNRGFLKVV